MISVEFSFRFTKLMKEESGFIPASSYRIHPGENPCLILFLPKEI